MPKPLLREKPPPTNRNADVFKQLPSTYITMWNIWLQKHDYCLWLKLKCNEADTHCARKQNKDKYSKLGGVVGNIGFHPRRHAHKMYTHSLPSPKRAHMATHHATHSILDRILGYRVEFLEHLNATYSK